MADNNRSRLKFFIRVDGGDRDISGSGVWRKVMPKVGKWRQVQGYTCCDPFFTTTSSSTTTTTSTTSTTTTAPSDFRLKVNIRPTGNKVGQFAEYTWEWNSTAILLGLDHFTRKGVIAQELVEAGSDAVFIGEDGFYRVDYGKIV